MCSMVDPSIFTTPGFRLTEEDFKSAIQKVPTVILWYLLEIRILNEMLSN